MNGSFLVILLGIPGILVATTVHEFVRALTSTVLGDTYPKSQGQVTLNPVKHFEPIGFLMMLYSGGFGWGKPVETSALYYKNRKRDTLLVAILPTVVGISFWVWCSFWLMAHSGARGIISAHCFIIWHIIMLRWRCIMYCLLRLWTAQRCLRCCCPANQYFKYMQNEKLIQMLFLFLLFFGMIYRLHG